MHLQECGDEPSPYMVLDFVYYFLQTHDKRDYSSKYTRFSDLYTYQNAKNPRSVDNTVDSVDKPLWITHTVFVNKGYARMPLTHGKPGCWPIFLQDALQFVENRVRIVRIFRPIKPNGRKRL